MKLSERSMPSPGSEREIERFLWLPTGLNVEGTSRYEVRWLERVTIKQKAVTDWDYPWSTYWEDQAFVSRG
jgi:hypothetical protein